MLWLRKALTIVFVQRLCLEGISGNAKLVFGVASLAKWRVKKIYTLVFIVATDHEVHEFGISR
jgi:hypothetical protein